MKPAARSIGWPDKSVSSCGVQDSGQVGCTDSIAVYLLLPARAAQSPGVDLSFSWVQSVDNSTVVDKKEASPGLVRPVVSSLVYYCRLEQIG